jgi:D-glycero-D-manno-heptose 1,7-bisphosphate phosphatase
VGERQIAEPQRPAVFLDRDGTLIRAFDVDGVSIPPAHLADVEILPGVNHALGALKSVGFRLIVVTNQPDVARGTQTRASVEAINAFLAECLPLDEIVCCFHDNADDCTCRKPKHGMLVDAAKKHGLHLAASYMVGDRWTDIEAGRRAGCTTVQVPAASTQPGVTQPDFQAGNLDEAARIILKCHKERMREAVRR